VLSKLRTEHLNKEERKSLKDICFEYQDVFFLLGDQLSCTTTVKHTIHLETGTVPINTHPYRLPESQTAEIDKQVTNLLKGVIIVQSSSPWNSQIFGSTRASWCRWGTKVSLDSGFQTPKREDDRGCPPPA
jgi:hypothetical protein